MPTDASDGGQAPSSDELCELSLTVGDHGGASNSDFYAMTVGPITHVAPIAAPFTANYRQFRPGQRYPVRIVWCGSIHGWPDYDYVAEISAVSPPAGVVMVIDDPDGILGWHGCPNATPIFDAANKAAYVNLVKVQITEPDGNPVTDNHFVFNTASPGICNVNATGTTGITQKNGDLTWTLDAITGSTLTSNPNPAKGTNMTFTYTILPSLNSQFGIKTLTLSHPQANQVTSTIEIFYSGAENAKNHPNPDAGTTPNWYYYYGQTSANTGGLYRSSGGSATSLQYPYDFYVAQLLVPHNCPPVGDNACAVLWGIDTYGWTSQHELRHHQNMMTWWPSGWNLPNANDQDQDQIPDNLEPGFGPLEGGPYDPTKFITYPVANWPTIDDPERQCLFTQWHWTIGSLSDQDWAYPGSQWN